MNEHQQVTIPKRRLHSIGVTLPETTVMHITYGLYAASLITAVPALLGVIFAHLVYSDVEGTWLESHARWQIKTFWIMVVATIIGTLTTIVGIGFLILGVTWLWFAWRSIKGWLSLKDQEPVE